MYQHSFGNGIRVHIYSCYVSGSSSDFLWSSSYSAFLISSGACMEARVTHILMHMQEDILTLLQHFLMVSLL